MRHDATTRRGFTLIELGVVMLIIGLILSMILVVSFSATEQARVRATQALITKLEVALNDRIEGLLNLPVNPNGTHRFLAAINPGPNAFNGTGYPPGSAPLYWGLTSEERAGVIARIDQFRMDLPDVFYIQRPVGPNPTPNDYQPTDYLVNFAGLPFPPGGTNPMFGAAQATGQYVLPLGNRVGPGFTPSSKPVNQVTAADLDPDGDGNPNVGPGAFVGGPLIDQTLFGGVPDRGIYGASFSARAALAKNMGYGPLGYDGLDNNGNGLTDEHGEGFLNNTGDATQFARFLKNHKHETARAEMLYLMLVEGLGVTGNVFTAIDFRDTELKDTDDDGIPEFVDGWGKPLQFYRWPIFFPVPGVSRGVARYDTISEVRDVFPLDPNKQLMAPSWWLSMPFNGLQKTELFRRYFTNLVDPDFAATTSNFPGPPYAGLWDMTGTSPRRSYGCRFLILSGGPDRDTGVYTLTDSFIRTSVEAGSPDRVAAALVGNYDSGTGFPQVGENWAVYLNGYPMITPANVQQLDPAAQVIPYAPPDVSLDNVTNQGLRDEIGGAR